MRIPYRIMTVCTGNICRSPMAEIVLRDRFESAGLSDLIGVDSTGVSAEELGNPIDRRARAVLVAHGYEGGGAHRARQVLAAQMAERDLVLAMTSQHAAMLRRLARRAGDGFAIGERVRMYRSFDPAALGSAGGVERLLDVADPWYGGRQDFEDCLVQVEAAVDGIVAHVRAHTAGSRPAQAEPPQA